MSALSWLVLQPMIIYLIYCLIWLFSESVLAKTSFYLLVQPNNIDKNLWQQPRIEFWSSCFQGQ